MWAGYIGVESSWYHLLAWSWCWGARHWGTGSWAGSENLPCVHILCHGGWTLCSRGFFRIQLLLNCYILSKKTPQYFSFLSLQLHIIFWQIPLFVSSVPFIGITLITFEFAYLQFYMSSIISGFLADIQITLGPEWSNSTSLYFIFSNKPESHTQQTITNLAHTSQDVLL